NKSFEHVFLQDMDEAGIFFLESHYELGRDARYSQVVVQKGGALTRLNISAKLNGENAEADMHGLYAPKGKSHFDVSSYIEHAAPHNYSRQVYKGIIDDQSKGIFAGKVKVNKGSLLITAEQLNKNLLLTPKAQAFSRPQMEIDADDVKCAHGSTTGQLSEKELFYFESRGIRRDKARAMLAQGFAMDVILKTKNETIRNLLIENL
ncbi:MAG: SufD family Fe-S cluster assembly protein, partial [Bdellovibrionota bacterium]|nr:SufD family Fe-S cluster assembly protein [Bdellovibrionota bacterium]